MERRKWIKWVMTAAAGCLPALAIADEPVKPNKPPQRIEVQVDDPPPPDLEQFQRVLAARGPVDFKLDVKWEKGAWLGISASAPPAVLRKQLGLAPGMGLVVEFIAPESPAAKAGLQQYDVLQKLDDQLLVNHEQLTVLVRSRKPGDEITLGIIREGKPRSVSAKLIEHDVEPLTAESEYELQIDRFLPEPHVGQIGPGQFPQGGTYKVWTFPANNNHPTSLTWLENDRSYTLVTDPQGRMTFTVKGKDGKVIFEGPVNSKEEREKVPADLREKLGKLEKRRVPLGPGGANPTTLPSHLKEDADKK